MAEKYYSLIYCERENIVEWLVDSADKLKQIGYKETNF